MRVDLVAADRIEVALSRRNLLALLSKVDRTESARTMEKHDEYHDIDLVVRCEPDAEHCGARGYPPGPVVADDDPGFEGDQWSEGRPGSGAF